SHYLIRLCLFFFFSSRRRHTRWPRDWSSDVCSSDLVHPGHPTPHRGRDVVEMWVAYVRGRIARDYRVITPPKVLLNPTVGLRVRSEERRVGKECRCRWSGYH